MDKDKYIYEGPVMVFEKCVCNHWKGETYAVSESKAKCNLSYQYKNNNGLVASAKVNLPGKCKRID